MTVLGIFMLALVFVLGFTFVKKIKGGAVNSMFNGVPLVPAMLYNVGEQMLYHDKHGRYIRRGEIISIKGGVAHLRCGHENNSTFQRPLVSLRRAFKQSATA